MRKASAARLAFEQAAVIAAAARVGAEQVTERLVGVFDEHFQILAAGKAFASLPFADGGDGETEFDGDLFERDALFAPPVAERVGKIPAQVAFETRLRRHAGFHHNGGVKESGKTTGRDDCIRPASKSDKVRHSIHTDH